MNPISNKKNSVPLEVVNNSSNPVNATTIAFPQASSIEKTDKNILQSKHITTISSPTHLKAKVQMKLEKELEPPHPAKQMIFDRINDLKWLSKADAAVEFHKICGLEISYASWRDGETIPSPHPEIGEYIVNKSLTNERGLQIVVLTPKNKQNKSPPIFCCRGTVLPSLHNLIDNIGASGKKKGIGHYSFEISETEIRHKIKELAYEFGPVVVTGHSLGGALAQIITTTFMDDQVMDEGKPKSVIKECYYLSAPGVDKPTAKEFKAKKRELTNPPEIIDIHHKDDLIYYAGAKHLPSDKEYIPKHPVGGRLEAHSNMAMLFQIAAGYMHKAKVKLKEKVAAFIFRAVVESVRTGLILKVVNFVLHHLVMQERVKMLAATQRINIIQKNIEANAAFYGPRFSVIS